MSSSDILLDSDKEYHDYAIFLAVHTVPDVNQFLVDQKKKGCLIFVFLTICYLRGAEIVKILCVV